MKRTNGCLDLRQQTGYWDDGESPEGDSAIRLTATAKVHKVKAETRAVPVPDVLTLLN